MGYFFFFSSRRRHTRYWRDWSSDVCSSDLHARLAGQARGDDDDVGALGALVGPAADADDLRLEALDGPGPVPLPRHAPPPAPPHPREHDRPAQALPPQADGARRAAEPRPHPRPLPLPAL